MIQRATTQPLRGRSAWWMEGMSPVQAGWRSSSKAGGPQFVMMTGTWSMPRWCVDSWAVGGCCLHHMVPVLDLDKGVLGWLMSTAMAKNLSSHSVATEDCGPTAVVTSGMLVLFVKVIHWWTWGYTLSLSLYLDNSKTLDLWLVFNQIYNCGLYVNNGCFKQPQLAQSDWSLGQCAQVKPAINTHPERGISSRHSPVLGTNLAEVHALQAP